MRAARVVAETALDNALRQHGDTTGAVVEDGEVRFEVKKVVKLGARAYAPGLLQVQWAGWEGHEKESTWQRVSDVPQLFIDEFHAEAAAAAARKRRKRAAPSALLVPYIIAAAGGAPQEVQEQRRDDAEYIEEEMGRAAVAATRRERQRALFFRARGKRGGDYCYRAVIATPRRGKSTWCPFPQTTAPNVRFKQTTPVFRSHLASV